jgi:hypothetical protein
VYRKQEKAGREGEAKCPALTVTQLAGSSQSSKYSRD